MKTPVLFPQNGVWLLQGRENRRVRGVMAPRVAWVQDGQALGRLRVEERRRDADTVRVLAQLLALAQRGEVVGLVCGAVRANGPVDLVACGLPYDVPLLADGLVVRLAEVMRDWEEG